MQNLEIEKYTEIALRRKYWIIIPALLSILGGMVHFLQTPKIYEAATLILVQPQRVPGSYVRPIMEGTVEGRLRTISQQVTSRTNLEKIIAEYKLGAESENSLDADELVNAVRKRIRIDVRGQGQGDTSTFTIAFQAQNPETSMKVANALSSTFIEENLKIREEQGLGTVGFLSDELEGIRKRLVEKEDELKKYSERYMGGLPGQLQTNLAILGRLEGQSDQINNSLRDAENRKILIQTQLTDRSKARMDISIPATENNSGVRNIQSLRNELASLESRYTNDHPDVIRLREMIAALGKQAPGTTANPEASKDASAADSIELSLRKQLKGIEYEIDNSKEEIKKTRSQINSLKTKVEDMPRREQELLSLNRDYDNLKGLYSSLLNRKLEADIAVSLERKQKGEQFRVIDPAKMPFKPIKPDINKILLYAIVIGLGLGLSLAYLTEILDSSYRKPEEIERELKIPVLMSIPVRYSVQEMKRIKRINFLKAASVSVGFVVSAAGIVLATKGVAKTIEFVNSIIERI